MAITRAGNNVILSTADADSIAGPLRVKSVKVVGGASGMTVKLKDAGTSGVVLYSSTVAADTEKWEEVSFRSPGAIYVNISAGGGTVYIYLK